MGQNSRRGFNNALNVLLQFSTEDADVEPKGQGYRVNANEIFVMDTSEAKPKLKQISMLKSQGNCHPNF